jgi:hypothetical protein
MTTSAAATVAPANATAAMTACRISQRVTTATMAVATANQAANPPNTATATAAPTSQSIEVTLAFIMAPFCAMLFSMRSL